MRKTFILMFLMMFCSFGFGQNHWNQGVDGNSFPDHLNVIATVHIDEELQGGQNSNLELAAFCGDELRGVATLVYEEGLGKSLAYLMLYGKEGDQITFRVYDGTSKKEYIDLNVLDYKEDYDYGYGLKGKLGQIDSPYEVSFSAVASVPAQGYEVIYETLPTAVEAANAEQTVTLLKSVQGAGLKINKDITVDFGGKTYTINQAVGSTGTESQGFQLLKNNTVTLKNGNIAIAENTNVKWMFNAYAKVTLQDLNVNCTNMAVPAANEKNYVLVVNNGGGATPTVNYDDVEIEGFTATNAPLYVDPSTKLVAEAGLNVETDKGYVVEYADNAYTAVAAVAKIGDVYYRTLPLAVEAATAGQTVELIADATGAGLVINKDITVDFGGKTYTINQAVGSTGTESQGFQLLKDNTVTLQNGYIAIAKNTNVKWMFNAYANVTLAGLNVNCDNMATPAANEANYVLVVNNGGGATPTVNYSGVNVTNFPSTNQIWLDPTTTFKAVASLEDLIETEEGYVVVYNNGEYTAVKANVQVKDGETVKGTYATIAEAVTEAQAGNTIVLLNDMNENATITKNLTIDGAGKNYTGTMSGNNSLTITIKNVNFVNAGFVKGSGNAGTYTFTNCTFDGAGNTYYYPLKFKGANKITVEECTVKDYKYSFLYVTSSTTTVNVNNVTVENCPNYAVYFSSGVAKATFKNLTVKNSDRGFLINNTANRAFTIENCKLENVTTAIDHANGTYTITCTMLGNKNDFGASALSEYAKIVLAETEATLSAPESLNVTTSVEGKAVVYENGVYKVAPAVASITANEVTRYYATLQAAVNAAQANETVTLLSDAAGAGVVIDKNVIIDFNDKTYTVNQAVGSSGTETLGFQILKNNNVTLKNGTLTSTTPVVAGKEVKMLIQNYANLTLTDMNLVDNTDHILYALSNNSGTSNINGTTSITTDAVAFDVYDYTAGGYAVPTVNVSTTGTIAGAIVVSETATLNISAGTFTVEIEEAWCADGFIPKDNGDGTWTVKVGQYVARIGGTGYETLDEAFAAAQNGNEVKILVAGTYALNTSGKDITITGAVDGVVFDNIGAKNMGGANVTFNNVTFDYYPNVNYTGLQHSGDLVYNNCTINGQVFLYGTSETFNECIFNQNSADAYNVWTYGAKDVDFIECTFNSVGKSVLIYAEGASIFNNVNVTKCTFNASAPVDGKAAIEMDSSLTAGINLTIDDATTATGFDNGNVSGNSLWNNKKGNETEANNDITVVVNDETVLAPLTLVAAAGGTNYTSLQAAYNAVAADGTITILNDVTGAGLVIDKNVTIDFNEKTYTFNEGVGSGTLTSNGFQILQGNDVVLNNGKLEVAAEAADKFYILVQNYANLTVKDMNLDGTNLDKWSLTDGDSYVLSNNSGTVTITGATNITANDEGDKAFAFDVCKYANYAAPIVNVNTTGIIDGKIEVSSEIPTNLNISGGTFTVEIEEAWCADGFIPVKNADDTWTVKVGKFIAQTETGAKFETLQEAVNAGTTVTLLGDATGAGVVINKDVTIDFNNKTYTVNQAVGSSGTETLGFQILKDNDVTLKNGTLTSTTPVVSGKDVKMLIQNYANLTLTDMNLVDNTDHILYALSNNSGTSNIEGVTNITTDAVAFDVYDYTAGGYAVPTVNVSTTGKITGAIEVSVTATLNISAGTFTNEIYEEWCAEFFSPYYNETDKTWTVVLTGGVQTIQLGNGWNWFSSYVDMSGENGLATLQDALGTSGRQIKSQVTNHFSSYSVENQEWYGNSEFTSLHKEKMYMIQTSTDVELELSGDFIDYEETPIQVNKGWNWISYPVNETVDINEALKDLNASDNDIVKMHGSTYATYYNGEWLAYEEMTLKPGQGYMYYRKASDATSFVYNVPAENNNNKTNVAATDYRWTSASAEYANNMTITAMLSVDGELVRGDYEIAALVNGEVRGNARPVYIESLDAYMLFMTVFGDDVEEVTFRYYDVETGAEFDLDNNIIYSTDAIVGSIEEPYMFNLDILNIGETSIDEINVYPNPTTIGREISLDATCDTVEVFNALGVKVAEYHNVDSIDAIETAGIYVIRVTIDGNARNCRLVVK